MTTTLLGTPEQQAQRAAQQARETYMQNPVYTQAQSAAKAAEWAREGVSAAVPKDAKYYRRKAQQAAAEAYKRTLHQARAAQQAAAEEAARKAAQQQAAATAAAEAASAPPAGQVTTLLGTVEQQQIRANAGRPPAERVTPLLGTEPQQKNRAEPPKVSDVVEDIQLGRVTSVLGTPQQQEQRIAEHRETQQAEYAVMADIWDRFNVDPTTGQIMTWEMRKSQLVQYPGVIDRLSPEQLGRTEYGVVTNNPYRADAVPDDLWNAFHRDADHRSPADQDTVTIIDDGSSTDGGNGGDGSGDGSTPPDTWQEWLDQTAAAIADRIERQGGAYIEDGTTNPLAEMLTPGRLLIGVAGLLLFGVWIGGN